MDKIFLKDIIEKPLSGEWGEEDADGTGTPVIRTANFTNDGVIDFTKIITRQVDVSKKSEKFLRTDDIIIEKSGGTDRKPVGRVVYYAEENNKYMFNNFAAVLRVKDSNNILSRYLFYFLFGFYNSGKICRYENKTTGIHNLKLDLMLKSVVIKFPSVIEQEKIVSTLDSVQSLLTHYKQQLELLDTLVKARFVEMFGDPVLNDKGWEVNLLGTISTMKSGGTPSRKIPEYFIGIYPWITTVALGNLLVSDADANEHITEQAIENSATKIIPADSLLFGIRVGIGKVSRNIVPICTNQDIVAIMNIDTDHYDLTYIQFVLFAFSSYFDAQKRGATIQGITTEILKNIKIITPPLSLQNQFASFVQQVEKTKEDVRKGQEKAQMLFDSLMQEYFG